MRRNRFLPYVGLIVLATSLLSCGKAGKGSGLAIDKLSPADEIVLTQWRILGPFGYEEKEGEEITEKQIVKRLYDDDFLTRFGLAESHMDYARFLKLRSGDDFINDIAETYGHVLDFGRMLQVEQPAAAYAVREIDAPGAQAAVLVGQMRGQGLKMWLNNELVIEQDSEDFAHRLANLKPVQLKKGKNLLLAKVVSKDKSFQLIASLMTVELAREKAREYGKNRVVKQNVIGREDELELDLLLDDLNSVQQVEILDAQKNSLDQSQYRLKKGGKIEFENLDQGLYYCRVGVPSDRFETEFYRGDVEAALAAYKQRVAAVSSDEQTRINLEALLIRYEHLLASDNKQPDKPEWQVKVVYVINELEAILRNLAGGTEAFKHCPGRHLRGFKSQVDDQVEHYMVYVPPQYAETRAPIPLVVFVPHAQSPQRPFLKSVYVATTDLIEHFTRAADRNGYAVLWTNGSGTWGGASLNQKGMTNILEAIAAVEQDYAIDSDRVYLWGSCAGARDALMLASRYPDKFAAVGLLSTLSECYTVERGDRASKNYAREWLKANSPIYCAENLSNIPIYALTAERDEHTPLEETQKYIEKCRGLGMQVRFDILPFAYDYYYPDEPTARILDFYKDKVRVQRPAQIQLRTWQLKYGSAYWIKIDGLVETMKCARIKAAVDDSNTVNVETENIRAYEIKLANLAYHRDRPLTVMTNGRVKFNGIPRGESIVIAAAAPGSNTVAALSKNANIEGPILHALTGGFIVVEGTQGPSEDRQKAGALSTAFCRAWREDYFQDCLHKKDDEITGRDIEDKNLILFGNDRTNGLIKRIIGQIPLKFSSGGITLGNKVYQGANLGVRLVYPNPLNKNRYIVIIGGNDLTNLPFDEKCLAIEGWYDFMIWKPWQADQSLIDIGYFDQRWKGIISLI
jgi:dienelactone hydrolase